MPTPLDYAHSMQGMAEASNPDVIKHYLQTGGVGLDPATQAWCAAFVNATLNHAGVPGTNSNMALSFLNWGNPVTGAPQQGDLAVFRRGANTGLGHVGFVDSFDPKTGLITLVGGDQGPGSGAVNAEHFPLADAAGIRRYGGNMGTPAAVNAPDIASMTSPTSVPQQTSGAGAVAAAQPAPTTHSWMDYLAPPQQQPNGSNSPLARLFAGQNPIGDNPLRSMMFGALGKAMGVPTNGQIAPQSSNDWIFGNQFNF